MAALRKMCFSPILNTSFVSILTLLLLCVCLLREKDCFNHRHLHLAKCGWWSLEMYLATFKGTQLMLGSASSCHPGLPVQNHSCRSWHSESSVQPLEKWVCQNRNPQHGTILRECAPHWGGCSLRIEARQTDWLQAVINRPETLQLLDGTHYWLRQHGKTRRLFSYSAQVILYSRDPLKGLGLVLGKI